MKKIFNISTNEICVNKIKTVLISQLHPKWNGYNQEKQNQNQNT